MLDRNLLLAFAPVLIQCLNQDGHGALRLVRQAKVFGFDIERLFLDPCQTVHLVGGCVRCLKLSNQHGFEDVARLAFKLAHSLGDFPRLLRLRVKTVRPSFDHVHAPAVDEDDGVAMQKATNGLLEYDQCDVGLAVAFQCLPQMRKACLNVSLSLSVIDDPYWDPLCQKHVELVACPFQCDGPVLCQLPFPVIDVF